MPLGWLSRKTCTAFVKTLPLRATLLFSILLSLRRVSGLSIQEMFRFTLISCLLVIATAAGNEEPEFCHGLVPRLRDRRLGERL
jgi:hypothetical protein